jgi:lipoprotein-anchoring transpeptidase ErfK/SrfK
VRLAAFTVLLIGNLLGNQVHAEDVSTQPLTRVDCGKAEMAWVEQANVCSGDPRKVSLQPLKRVDCAKFGMAWDDTASVCGAASQAAQSTPTSEVAERSSQPLTRHECHRSGMAWDDTANVCSEESEKTAIQLAEPEAVVPTLLVNINKANQTMTVNLDGVQRYEWPVSTGLRGYTTPSGSYTARSMNEIWYSREWDNAPMPHAIFFTKKGHAIHGTEETRRLGRPASHGCVRLAPENARTLFALVKAKGLENTQIVLTGDTPGGESNVATSASRKQQSKSVKSRNKFERFEVPRRFGRGGWFRRYYAGPRGLPFYMGRQRGWR